MLKVTVVKDELDLQELEHFSIWQLVHYFIREQTNETTVSIGLFNNKTCFRVDPSDSNTFYTVHPSRRELKDNSCLHIFIFLALHIQFTVHNMVFMLQNIYFDIIHPQILTSALFWCFWLECCYSSLQTCSAGKGFVLMQQLEIWM